MHINTRFVLSLLAAIPTVFAVNGKCANGRNGICIATGTCSQYKGSTSNGNCPNDGNSIKCCENISCSVDGISGKCMFANECSGSTYSGKCPGGSDYKCCIKKPNSGGSGNSGNSGNSNTGVGQSCTDGSRTGTCINTSQKNCDGDLVSNRCPGAANVKCCLPKKPSGNTNTGVGQSCTDGSRTGTCINTSQKSCDGDLVSNKCPGAANVKCCLPKKPSGNTNTGVGQSCTDGSRTGTCINTNVKNCDGDLVSNRCPGAANVKCCLPKKPSENTNTGVGQSCTDGSRTGTCINTNVKKCDGDLVSNKCPGAANVKCCLPKKPSENTNTGVGQSCTDGSRTGTCINTNVKKCDGDLVSNKCPGAANVKCCLPKKPSGNTNTGVGQSCTDGSRTGTCINTNVKNCDGDLVSNRCPGAANIKCCLPKSSGNSNTGVGQSCNDGNKTGTCINTNVKKCDGNLVSNKCPGAANIKCCIPNGSPGNSNTGVGQSCNDGNRTGTCINTNVKSCDGDLVSNRCPGAANIKCCLPKSSGNSNTGVGQSCNDGNKTGTCINTNVKKCDGNLVSNKCPGAANIKCCIPNGSPGNSNTGVGQSCNDGNRTGTCINTNVKSCDGDLVSNRCPGAANIKCCLPKSSGNSNTGVGQSCNDGNRTGTCINTNVKKCDGNLVSNKCPGAANIKCCIPNGSPGNSNTGVGQSCNDGNRTGTCINTNVKSCDGDLVSNRCPGAANIKCCLPKSPGNSNTGVGQSCNDGNRTGTCINTNVKKCDGDLVSNKCPGAANIKCCIPSGSPGNSNTGVGQSCNDGNRTGTCINTNVKSCDGDLVSNRCPGASNVKCCIPSGSPGNSNTGVGAICTYGGETGKCINTNSSNCNGKLITGRCPGSNNVKCCITETTDVETTCKSGNRRGTCINTNVKKCNGDLVSGLCPGASNIRCCLDPDNSTGIGKSCNYKGVNGKCINTNTTKCNGSLVTGLCPGANNVKCCVGDESGVGKTCSSGNVNGICINSNVQNCEGRLVNGLCPGANNIKCCIAGPDTSGVGKSCSSGNRSGSCINTNISRCSGELVSGLCPGGNNIKCCLSNGQSGSTGVGTRCTDNKSNGTCIDVNKSQCSSGNLVAGKCPGGNNIKCCLDVPSDGASVGSICTYGGSSGTCIDVNTSACDSGNVVSGRCPGPKNIQCCLKGDGQQGETPSYDENEGVGKKCTAEDLGLSGTCINMNTSSCPNNNYYYNVCPGGENVQCCLQGNEQLPSYDENEGVGKECTAEDLGLTGTCINMNTSSCPNNNYYYNVCPGGENVQCCLQGNQGNEQLPSYDENEGVGKKCTDEDLGLTGTCINMNTSSCPNNNYYYNVCPGGDNVQCCLESSSSDVGKKCSSKGINGICIDVNETACKTFNVDFNACQGGDNVGCCLEEEEKPEGVGEKCSYEGLNGTCIDIDQNTCESNNIAYNICKGGSNIGCCLEKGIQASEEGVGTKCSDNGVNGTCIDINQTKCETYNVSYGLCPGGDNVECCLEEEEKPLEEQPTSGEDKGVGEKCSSNGINGTCIDINQTKCETFNVAYDICPGNGNVQCCLEEEEQTPSNQEEGVGKKCSSNGISGTCIDINQTKCETYNVAYDVCQGSENVQCCLDEPSEDTQYYSINLEIAPLKQANYPNEFATGCTISKEGSCITSITMALNQIQSLNYTPYDVAKKMNFYGCDVDYSSFGDLEFVFINDPDLSVVLDSLVNGNAVPYCGLSGGREHWVTVYGYNGDYNYNDLKSSDFLIHDPENNKNTLNDLLKNNDPYIALIYNYYNYIYNYNN